jgi:cadmium resistance transport/sequestration family protein
MNWFLTAISTGVVAFSATNIDDIVILLLFFSQVNNTTFTHSQIVVGQYLGFTALVVASLPGLFGGFVIPQNWIGLLGLIPIAIGISSLVNWEDKSVAEVSKETEHEDSLFTNFLSPQISSVASVTFANGSDNISVYLPLFASNDIASVLVIITVFFILIGVWCYAVYKLTYQREIAFVMTRYGNYFIPFILIGLGAFMVLKSRALGFIKLTASCLCLIVLVKNNESSDEIQEG